MPKSAPDLSEFEAAAPQRQCWFGLLDSEQKGKVAAAKAGGYSKATICTVLSQWGFKPPGDSAYLTHFTGKCRCVD